MKILIACYKNIGGYSGDVTHVIQVAKGLQKLGHEVQLVAPSIQRYIQDNELNIRYIPVLNLRFIQFLSYLFLSPIYFMLYFSEFKPDIVLLFEIHLDLGVFFACRLLNLPLVFYINGITSEEVSLTLKFRPVICLITLIENIYVKFASRIFVVTEAIKNYVKEAYNVSRDKISIVKNGVDAEIFRPIDKEEARKQLGFKQDNFFIGFIGSLFVWQGIDYLIEAVPLILKQIPNVEFVIVGKGNMSKIWQDKVRGLGLEGNFIFTGVVAFSQVPIYINAFDIGIVFFKPIRTDPGNPIKLYEYLACGKPVIASKVTGYGDFVEEIGAGISVDSGNPEAVAEAIISLIRNKRLREEMGRKGRSAVEAGHTWKGRASEIEHFLFEIKNK